MRADRDKGRWAEGGGRREGGREGKEGRREGGREGRERRERREQGTGAGRGGSGPVCQTVVQYDSTL